MNSGLHRDADTPWRCLSQAAERWPDKPFLNVLEDTAEMYGIPSGAMTYRDCLARVEKQAALYKNAGYGAGMRVGLLLENRPAFLIHFLALNNCGVSAVPINPDLRGRELGYVLAHSEMRLAVAVDGFMPVLCEAAKIENISLPLALPEDEIPAADSDMFSESPPDGNTEAALLYTSGSTGTPKGCVLANDYFLATAAWYTEAGGLLSMSEGCERMLTPLPLFHTNALSWSMMAMMRVGGCLTLLDRFHPTRWWDNVREAQASIIHYLGIMPALLMKAPASASDQDHSVRFGFGAGVSAELHDAFEDRFGFPLVEGWSMTETGGGATVFDHQNDRKTGQNCFGRPSDELEIRIVDDDGKDCPDDVPGEFLVRRAGDDRRAGFFRHYLKDKAATEEAWKNGWFHTGDVVRRDKDGFLFFVDRKKNMIRRSGENISAVSVEDTLQHHQAIASLAVAAAPDALRGEEVAAFIVLKSRPRSEKEERTLAEEILFYALQNMAYYKAPGWIVFVDALPLTATQKPRRAELKAMAKEIESQPLPSCYDLRALKKRERPAESPPAA